MVRCIRFLKKKLKKKEGSSPYRVGENCSQNIKQPFILAVFLDCKESKNDGMNLSFKDINDSLKRIKGKEVIPSPSARPLVERRRSRAMDNFHLLKNIYSWLFLLTNMFGLMKL